MGQDNVVDVLGVRFHNLSMKEVIDRVDDVVSKDQVAVFAFSNPEFVLEAGKSEFLKRYLNEYVQVNVADGIGVVWASRIFGTPLKERVTGTDFVPALYDLAVRKKYKIFFLGGRPGVAKTAKEHLAGIFGCDVVVGEMHGYFGEEDVLGIIDQINESEPDILMVCLGNPRQERWIFDNRDKLNVKLLFGNGGALDFWSGAVRRAPLLLQKFGLEWLFRLGQDFSLPRIKRQLSLVSFVAKVAIHSFRR